MTGNLTINIEYRDFMKEQKTIEYRDLNTALKSTLNSSAPVIQALKELILETEDLELKKELEMTLEEIYKRTICF